MPFILPLEPCQCLIPSLHIFLGSFSAAFVLDTGLTREVVVGEICHVACTDGESPKYLSIFWDRSVTPCHTHHSHVGVFCFYAWELCVNGTPETNSNNCLEASGSHRWAEMGPRWGGGPGVRDGIRGTWWGAAGARPRPAALSMSGAPRRPPPPSAAPAPRAACSPSAPASVSLFP